MAYSKQTTIDFGTHNDGDYLAIILSNDLANKFLQLENHVYCEEVQNWPIDVAFSQDGGTTLKQYIRAKLSPETCFCLVPLEGTEAGSLTVLWGDENASDYADSSKVLFQADYVHQSSLACSPLQENKTDVVDLAPPFCIIGACFAAAGAQSYFKLSTGDGFWLQFVFSPGGVQLKESSNTSSTWLNLPDYPRWATPWYFVWIVETDKHKIMILDQESNSSEQERTVDLSEKVFTTLEYNHGGSSLGVFNYAAVSYVNPLYPATPRTLKLEEQLTLNPDPFSLLPQTRRYWLFSGYVTEGGSAVQNPVYVMDHKTAKVVRTVSRLSDGFWEAKICPLHQTFCAQKPFYRELASEEMDKRFAIFCHDPDQVYNAKIYDHLTPVLVEIED